MNSYFIVAMIVMSLTAAFALVHPLVGTSRAKSKGNARLPMLVVVSAIILAIGLYGVLGRPGVPSSEPHANLAANNATGQSNAAKTDDIAPVGSLLAGLEERLASNPDDAKGWLLLAKSYQHLGQDEKARSAYDKAAALGQVDATFADSLATVAAPASDENLVEIRGHVSLSDAAMAQVTESDTVFVFAKALNGPPAPLAVIRRPVSDLPFDFVLSDAQSMVEGSGISSVETVVVTAKISAPGDALGTHLALESKSEPIATIDAPFLSLIISPTK